MTARNVSYNASIPPNGSIGIGFQATHTGNTAKPASFTLNGISLHHRLNDGDPRPDKARSRPSTGGSGPCFESAVRRVVARPADSRRILRGPRPKQMLKFRSDI